MSFDSERNWHDNPPTANEIRGMVSVFDAVDVSGCYIPLSPSKRKRSAEILDQVAARFGYPQFAEGGEIESRLKDDDS